MKSSHVHESGEKQLYKKHNFVIIGFWDLWKGWHQLLTEAWQHVYVCSLNWRQYTDQYAREHNVHAYNVFDLPIGYDDIDAVLICCTASDIDLLYDCLPKKLIEEKSNKMIFFQNGIGIRERIKQVFTNTSHPTQAVPYFSFKTNGWNRVDIALAKPSPITWNKELIGTLINVLNQWPHQNHRFEWMDSIVLQEIQQDIENAIEKFRTKYPSTYYQYYRSWTDPIRSDEASFIGVIMHHCKAKWVSLPLLEQLYKRMQEIKIELNKWKSNEH